MEEEAKHTRCERSLGADMRSNVIQNSSGEYEIYTNVKNGDETDQSLAYGLRQNPKKTWRKAGSNNVDLYQEERFCKECGKGFHSLKALCGHMACHSEKNRYVENDSWRTTSLNQISVVDSESENETGFPRPQRRSRRLRKSVVINDYYYCSSASGADHVSDQEEQAELAMCLMMLSRDSSGNWGCVNSFAESSDNNSVVFEARSLPVDMNFSMRDVKKNVSYGFETDEIKDTTRGKRMKFSDFDSNCYNQSDSGYLSNRYGKVESDDCVNEHFKNTEFEVTDTGDGQNGPKILKRYVKNEPVKGLIHDQDYTAYVRYDRDLRQNDSTLKRKYEAYSSAMEPDGALDAKSCKKKPKKRGKYECFICTKTFHSPQALGGHIASHNSKNSSCFASSPPNENSGKTVLCNSGRRKGKKHECPTCFKLFKSGQALGGHKRIHATSDTQESSPPKTTHAIDLNLPPPNED